MIECWVHWVGADAVVASAPFVAQRLDIYKKSDTLADMDFTTTTDLELAEFALDTRLSADDRADIIIELVRRGASGAYNRGYSDGVADAKNGIA